MVSRETVAAALMLLALFLIMADAAMRVGCVHYSHERYLVDGAAAERFVCLK